MPGSLTATPATASSASTYPSASTFPASTLYPGVVPTLTAVVSGSLTATPVTPGTLTFPAAP